jgi:alpha-beta hydrolase superfamily lysophospholipase
VPVDRRLLTLRAPDGQSHDAVLHVDERAARVRVRSAGRRTAVVHCHGALGNFLVGTLRFLPAPLARAGFPVLVVETRLGNVGQLFGPGVFDEATRDVDAAVAWLRDAGYSHVVLSGLSTGATLATRFAATRHLPALRGLVLMSNPWGLPQAMRRRSHRYGSEPPYEEATRVVRDALAADPEADRVFVVERSRGPTREPRHAEVYTHRTWWSTRGPNATPAMAFRQIGQVWAPILLVQGAADDLVEGWEPDGLAAIARRAGNPDVEVALLPGAGHLFKGHEVPLADTIVRWLRGHA